MARKARHANPFPLKEKASNASVPKRVKVVSGKKAAAEAAAAAKKKKVS